MIIGWDITKNLNCLLSVPQNFDLVFMDPPYDRNMIYPSLEHLQRTGKLKNGASIVIEHSSLETIPGSLSHFKIVDRRSYGKTIVSILKFISPQR